MKPSEALIDYVKRTVLLANTPAFIFNTLRDSLDVLDFANNNDNSNLEAELLSLSNKTNRTSEDLALAYLLLVALSYKSDFNIKKIDFSALKWIDWSSEIVSLISMVNSYSISTARIEVPYKLDLSDSLILTESSASYKSININNQPKG